jgi:DeoR family fructose operon transcriptional repressor
MNADRRVSGVLAEERRRWLTDEIKTSGSLAIAAAAAHLGVSEMTIRRDLIELEEVGALRRVRGGAVLVGPQVFAERTEAHARAKGQIANKLVALVPERGAIAVDASSTMLRLVAAISGSLDLTVVTNGPDTFAALQGRPGITPVLTGGTIDPATGSLVGPIACRSARQLAVDVFFTSAAAVDSVAGASEATLDESEVKQAFAVGAASIVLGVDTSKIDQRSRALSLDWSDIDCFVTEADPDDRRMSAYSERNLR